MHHHVGNLRVLILALLVIACGRALAADAAAPAAEVDTTVGRAAQINDLVLPAPELEVKPPTDEEEPFVLRMIDVAPHGSSFRYNLEYYALEPGEYNVIDYLQQAGTQQPAALPPHMVQVGEYLPRDKHTHPHPPETGELPFLGGYRMLMVAAAIAWFVVAVAIVMVGRKRAERRRVVSEPPRTLADRLRPAIEAAMAGKLDERQLAELERVMLAFWRQRLQLEDVPAAEALRRMRAHPQGGELLRQLERWLHQPGQREQIDAAALLAPYKQLPADALRTTREGQELVPA
jgi:hypothetical protein